MKINLNENFGQLSARYLFDEIAERVGGYKSREDAKRVISLGIGDVTRPLSRSVSLAMARASENMASAEGFCGYGDTFGLHSLRQAISERYYRRGVSLSSDEIFINDGAKSDLALVTDLTGDSCALIPDPVYPVYLDSSILAGKSVRLLSVNSDTFLPEPPQGYEPYVIYLCSPNNPTGEVFDRGALRRWVDFAHRSGSLIVFDAAYESYICDPNLPHSIFEIDGAKNVAMEICSFSKMAGFTGVRCGWCVLPHENPVHPLWRRLKATKFNGASYISQVGALAALSPDGERECAKNVEYYMQNATVLKEILASVGVPCLGGEHAPYLWLKCPQNATSWETFESILHTTGVVTTPGAGFGRGGEGYLRLSAFASHEETAEAAHRLAYWFG